MLAFVSTQVSMVLHNRRLTPSLRALTSTKLNQKLPFLPNKNHDLGTCIDRISRKHLKPHERSKNRQAYVRESLIEREGAARTRCAVGGWFDECTVGFVSVTNASQILPQQICVDFRSGFLAKINPHISHEKI